MSDLKPLVILCHSGGWDYLFQATSAAAAASTGGQPVTMVFFFAALEKLATGQLDRVQLAPPDPDREAALESRIVERGFTGPSDLLAAAQRTGRTQVLACSASTALTGHAPDDLKEVVDEIVGWPTVVQLMRSASSVLYL